MILKQQFIYNSRTVYLVILLWTVSQYSKQNYRFHICTQTPLCHFFHKTQTNSLSGGHYGRHLQATQLSLHAELWIHWGRSKHPIWSIPFGRFSETIQRRDENADSKRCYQYFLKDTLPGTVSCLDAIFIAEWQALAAVVYFCLLLTIQSS